MEDDTINMLPPPGSFGGMSRDQLLDIAKHPPQADAERRQGSHATDPLGASLRGINASAAITTQAALRIKPGSKCYHIKKKIEVKCISIEASGIVVETDKGKWFTAQASNLRLIG